MVGPALQTRHTSAKLTDFCKRASGYRLWTWPHRAGLPQPEVTTTRVGRRSTRILQDDLAAPVREHQVEEDAMRREFELGYPLPRAASPARTSGSPRRVVCPPG